jgi:hypothetical protein
MHWGCSLCLGERVGTRFDNYGELRAGDVVRVRSEAEILATLDPDGRLDGMPFMPEMLQHCGREVRVYRRADKTCDTIGPGPHRRLTGTVHLTDLRCGGEAHGGCQAACLLFWKEAWLERVDGASDASPAPAAASDSPPAPPDRADTTRETLLAATRTWPAPDDGEDGEPTYTCQATEVLRASTPMRWWEPGQYVRDVRSGNAGIGEVVADLVRWLFVAVYIRLTGSSIPFVHGLQEKTPRGTLGLQPGDPVRVRSRAQIEATLDRTNHARGLSFDAEMLRYCGTEATVRTRVERLIDEQTGRMRHLTSDCLILEGAYCTAAYHLACPRAIFPYWREVWLERLDSPAGITAGSATAVAGADAETRPSDRAADRPRSRAEPSPPR